ncbi:terminase small subunit, partial [Vibrio phage D530]
MAADRRPNRRSATEDELGDIHSMTTKLHALRLKGMLKAITDGLDAEAVIGDGKALQAAGKWAADQNSITCATPEADSESELSKRLAEVRKAQFNQGARATGTDNVIPFDDGED